MTLSPGTRLGPYEIVSPLGAGGMGEVYRARDGRLKRDVALKILPASFAADPDRLARFQREAEVLASLNHPHIAAIHGLEESGPTRALVLELVEGETLAERIARGPLPLDEALAVARQIAEALEAAHDHGLIHRDLKPANVKVRPDGTVKVLDFGLAKLAANGPNDPNSPNGPNDPNGPNGPNGPNLLSMSPTLTSPALMTGTGVILGTAAYMSPEQAKGRTADRRSDVWAFGCVLYEMLTGGRPFPGDDLTDVLASVLKTDPDWSRLSVPPRVLRLLQLALARDPAARIPHASVLRVEIDEIRRAPDEPRVALAPAPRRTWSRLLPVAVTALAAAAAAGTAVWLVMKPAPAPPTRLALLLHEQTLANNGAKVLAMAPNGRRIAYLTNNELFVRDLDAYAARSLTGPAPGDTYLMTPVFSPTGHEVAYWSSDGSIKRISVTSGAPVAVTRLPTGPPGLTWHGDDLLFALDRRIVRVPVRGGEPETLITVADGRPSSPQMLPGGMHVLYTLIATAGQRVVVQRIDAKEHALVAEGGRDATYLPSGHIAYAVGADVLAVPFDIDRMQATATPVPVIEGVRSDAVASQFVVSAAGTLAYVPGPATLSTGSDIVVVARSGTVTPLRLPPQRYAHVRASPDGRNIAVQTNAADEATIFVYELAGRTAPRRLTFGGGNRFPIWSADGSHVTFQSDREGDAGLFWQRADGSAPAERLTKAAAGEAHTPESWSPDGGVLLYSVTRGTQVTLWAYNARQKAAAAFGGVEATTPTAAVFSPDGRWVAYGVDNTVFVQPFPATGARYQVSPPDAGHHPLWSHDGLELWYEPAPGQLRAATVETRPAFAVTAGAPLPSSGLGSTSPRNPRHRDLLPDGRWIAPGVAEQADQPGNGATEIRVVLNWLDDVRQTAR